MKKIILLVLAVGLLTSCGGDKKKEATKSSIEEQVVKDNYSIVFEAIYEKDDELSMIFKKVGYWDYVHTTTFKVKGQPTMQKLTFEMPKGLSIENAQIDLSSNKEQKTVTIRGINVINNGKEVINGANMEFVKYFNTGTGLTWDAKKLRYNLIFGGEYPPRIVGNDVLESILVK